ncbi:hypothetical protein IC582_028711 [Cucumis melo]
MQVSSSKDKNPVIKDMSFYGLIQEIWELNYNTFDVPSLHTMDILMDDFNEELGVGELNTTFGIEDEEKEIGTGNEILKQMKRPQESTIMFDVTRIKCLGEKKVVRYNEDGAIGENGVKLKSFIGYSTHYHVHITYTSWKSVLAELK